MRYTIQKVSTFTLKGGYAIFNVKLSRISTNLCFGTNVKFRVSQIPLHLFHY